MEVFNTVIRNVENLLLKQVYSIGVLLVESIAGYCCHTAACSRIYDHNGSGFKADSHSQDRDNVEPALEVLIAVMKHEIASHRRTHHRQTGDVHNYALTLFNVIGVEGKGSFVIPVTAENSAGLIAGKVLEIGFIWRNCVVIGVYGQE